MSIIRQNKTSHLQLRAATDGYIAALKSTFASIVHQIALYRERSQTRPYLASMSDKMLEDIGISRLDALKEAEKPFWRA